MKTINSNNIRPKTAIHLFSYISPILTYNCEIHIKLVSKSWTWYLGNWAHYYRVVRSKLMFYNMLTTSINNAHIKWKNSIRTTSSMPTKHLPALRLSTEAGRNCDPGTKVNLEGTFFLPPGRLDNSPSIAAPITLNYKSNAKCYFFISSQRPNWNQNCHWSTGHVHRPGDRVNAWLTVGERFGTWNVWEWQITIIKSKLW
jgi:hypothetical protein